ncbi:hypothetical protein FQZ97_1000030 [compost metagenome]
MQQRLACPFKHFQCANDTLAVGWTKRCCNLRITHHKHSMKSFRPLFAHPIAPIFTYLDRHLRHLRQPTQQRLIIKPRTADKNWYPSLKVGTRKQDLHIGEPFAGRIGNRGGNMPIKIMLSLAQLIRLRACTQQVEHIINLHRIGVQDEATSLLCHMKGKS